MTLAEPFSGHLLVVFSSQDPDREKLHLVLLP